MVLPWICSENYDETLKEIKKSKAKIVMGHLELQGFRVSHGTVLTKCFLYLLRATFYPAKLFWSEPPKPSFQGFGRELSRTVLRRPLGFRDWPLNSNVKPP